MSKHEHVKAKILIDYDKYLKLLNYVKDAENTNKKDLNDENQIFPAQNTSINNPTSHFSTPSAPEREEETTSPSFPENTQALSSSPPLPENTQTISSPPPHHSNIKNDIFLPENILDLLPKEITKAKKERVTNFLLALKSTPHLKLVNQIILYKEKELFSINDLIDTYIHNPSLYKEIILLDRVKKKLPAFDFTPDLPAKWYKL